MSEDARVWAGEGLTTKGTGELRKVMELLYLDCGSGYPTVDIYQNVLKSSQKRLIPYKCFLVMGRTVSLERHVEVLTPSTSGPQNVTVFGNTVVSDPLAKTRARWDRACP